eukprot:TRINITY_DN8208_c0_g1_i2.p1 TRINITY_DN8208_c0_g1~~TRINITY_DN8208_c0_g1_i2.p1  ORF type:complete len:313 (-),score=77.76 TRINITY_DN8208_c0_g1_i2:17-955(-)
MLINFFSSRIINSQTSISTSLERIQSSSLHKSLSINRIGNNSMNQLQRSSIRRGFNVTKKIKKENESEMGMFNGQLYQNKKNMIKLENFDWSEAPPLLDFNFQETAEDREDYKSVMDDPSVSQEMKDYSTKVRQDRLEVQQAFGELQYNFRIRRMQYAMDCSIAQVHAEFASMEGPITPTVTKTLYDKVEEEMLRAKSFWTRVEVPFQEEIPLKLLHNIADFQGEKVPQDTIEWYKEQEKLFVEKYKNKRIRMEKDGFLAGAAAGLIDESRIIDVKTPALEEEEEEGEPTYTEEEIKNSPYLPKFPIVDHKE